MICTAPRLPPGCLCVGGAGYGNVCAAWDAADEEPWCRVSTRDACGEDETFVSGAHFWAHRACSGRGATFDTVTARVRNAVSSVEPRGVCDRAAGGGARLSGADAACCRVFDGKRGATVNQQQKCCHKKNALSIALPNITDTRHIVARFKGVLDIVATSRLDMVVTSCH